jgi:hypothetical protein
MAEKTKNKEEQRRCKSKFIKWRIWWRKNSERLPLTDRGGGGGGRGGGRGRGTGSGRGRGEEEKEQQQPNPIHQLHSATTSNAHVLDVNAGQDNAYTLANKIKQLSQSRLYVGPSKPSGHYMYHLV